MNRYERLLCRLRQDSRLWEEGSKAMQIERILEAVKRRLQPVWAERVRTAQEERLNRWHAIQ
jgi:uncharacterized protein YmfQ (DUF2313 family)